MKRTLSAAATAAGLLAGALFGLAPAAHADTAPNGYPYCANGSASDPDGDGWGWENGASCVVRGSKADPAAGTSGTASNGYPYCVNGSATDPDGDGWGWENGASCVVRGSKADPGAGSSGGGGGSSSTACPSGMSCGSYSVGGLGGRKGQVRAAGATSLDLAVAMLETDHMDTAYPYGDNKSGDAANFGIFKQNWMMLRAGCAQFAGQSESQYNNGAALNSNLAQDVNCLHQSQNHYGLNTWFAGHRNGSSGLANPNTADIANYRAAVYWIKAQLDADSANLGNDTRFWVQVPAI
ncbi:carbohydrate-binding domain-containing protein [Kitasatospora cineracea]|uniref:carbohydrate-binding domain-containing protein n=1 Tax=Kitasatospora cineracea TaxID=88074 RepID=UPI00379AB07D